MEDIAKILIGVAIGWFLSAYMSERALKNRFNNLKTYEYRSYYNDYR